VAGQAGAAMLCCICSSYHAHKLTDVTIQQTKSMNYLIEQALNKRHLCSDFRLALQRE
jgi:hypothetical protein